MIGTRVREDRNTSVEGLITIDEASRLVGRSKSSLYKDLTRGRITSIRFNGKQGRIYFLATTLLRELSDGSIQ